MRVVGDPNVPGGLLTGLGGSQAAAESSSRRGRKARRARAEAAEGAGGGGGGGGGEDKSSGWSPPFSLLLGPFSAERAFRAGGYDLAVDIQPVETAAREVSKVVTFVQRFWLSNKLDHAIEVEQWGGPSGARLEQPLHPLAADERAPFHWPQPKMKEDQKLLRLRALPGQGKRGFVPDPSHPDEGWSSAFPIDTHGRFVVHCDQVRTCTRIPRTIPRPSPF